MSAFTPRGVFTALATPFTPDGAAVDWASYEALVRAQVAAGVAGVVPCGTTGESPTLSDEETARAIEIAVRLTAGSRTAVLAGTGSNDTAAAVAKTRAAKAAGAGAALVVSPYYNRPTQAGLLAHFTAVAAEGLPVVVYNIPGRAAVALAKETLVALAALPGVVAVKDATGGLDMCADLALAAPALVTLSGDDALTLPFLALGGRGAVSVVSNLCPRGSVALVDAALAGDFARARALHEALLPLARAAFVESNPAPIKALLADAGVIACAALRLPLVPLAAESLARARAGAAATRAALAALGIVEDA
jgi:4-hydroxy-tetrahydrodipicolinate synthase